MSDPKKHNRGFNRDDNDFGRNRDFIIPEDDEGDEVLDTDERDEYEGNLGPIPDDRVDID